MSGHTDGGPLDGIRIVEARPEDRPSWEAFVASRSEADVLQSWSYGEASAESGERPTRLAAWSPGGGIIGVAQALVRATVAGRTVLYVPHGPVWDRSSPARRSILEALLAALRRVARANRGIVVKVDPCSVRTGPSDAEEVRAMLLAAGLRSARFDLQARTTVVAELTQDPAAVAAGWTWYARNRHKRAQRAGVAVEIVREADRTAIGSFQRLLGETAERAGFRGRSQAFLERLAAELAPTGGWYLATAHLEGRPVAGMVAARVGEQAFYLYGGTRRDESVAHAHVGYATMGSLILALAADGVRRFDLWGIHDERDAGADASWLGFTRFKRQFARTELRHPGTFDLVVDPLLYRVRDWRERLKSGRRGSER